MRLNKERTGCGLSMDSPYTHDELKIKMNMVAECLPNVFVPSDVSWEGDKYYFYVSHRQSLKEYIYENGFKPKDFFTFMRAMADVFKIAEEQNIDIHEFIMDYECIFIGSSLSEIELIYAPDSFVYSDKILVNNKYCDMASIISLHIEYNDYDENEKLVQDITQLLDILSGWEEYYFLGKSKFPYSELLPHMSTEVPFYEKLILYIQNKMEEFAQKFSDFFEKKGRANMKLKGQLFLDGMEYSDKGDDMPIVNIGRDKSWADIELSMLFISRKHATVYKNEDKWYIKDLNSKNGTFVNGEKITAQEPVCLKNGNEISFGIKESKFIFCLP